MPNRILPNLRISADDEGFGDPSLLYRPGIIFFFVGIFKKWVFGDLWVYLY